MPDGALEKATLPDGQDFILRMAYSSREVHGVTVLVVVSCISLVAVVGLLIVIALSAFYTRMSLDKHLFVRNHVAAYFICMLLCDFMQALASMLNVQWIHTMAVEVGPTCTAQGILKHISDVGSAFWTLIIAIHTFCLLVLEIKVRPFILYTTLIGVWSAIGAFVIAGPATLDIRSKGPFHSISGYWCWISQSYPTERVTLDYMIMFMAAVMSFILYSLIFLRLRGNLVVNDGLFFKFRRRSIEQTADWRGRKTSDQAHIVARQMLLYPVAYTVVVVPLAVTRLVEFSGHNVPFEATVFSSTVFLLSGLVNVILFSTTRRILPPLNFDISRPKLLSGFPRTPRTGGYRDLEKNPPFREKRLPTIIEDAPDPILDRFSDGLPSDESSYRWDNSPPLVVSQPPPMLSQPPLSNVIGGVGRGIGHRRDASDASDATAASLPYEHTVQPLNIKKNPSIIGPRPPPRAASVRTARGTKGESLYSLYRDMTYMTVSPPPMPPMPSVPLWQSWDRPGDAASRPPATG